MTSERQLRSAEPRLLIDYSNHVANLDDERFPPERNLEITDVDTMVVEGNYEWTFVRIYTNDNYGTGEAYWGKSVPTIIDSMKPYLIGENPMDIDRIFSHLIQRMSGEGSIAGPVISAISGIEIALHDLVGKVLNVPAYQLLGGKYRDQVRLYCDCHAGAHLGESFSSKDPAEIYTPDEFVKAAKEVIDDGYEILKFDLDGPLQKFSNRDRMSRQLNTEEISALEQIVAALVDNLDNSIKLAFDCHWSWSSESAIRLAKSLEDFDILWLEDPIPPEDDEGHKMITQRTSIPIASGENLYRKHQALKLITNRSVDIYHMDMPKSGGMREAKQIADIAGEFSIPFALHNVSSPLGTVAGAHVGCTIPNFVALEHHGREITWWESVIQETVIEKGSIRVPEKPGIGVTLDFDVINDHLAEDSTLFESQ